MIHRAIYGSFERMIGILTEHFFGKWPFWLSPRQILVISVGVKFNDYAQKVRDTLYDAGFFADVDLGPNTLPRRRSAVVSFSSTTSCLLLVMRSRPPTVSTLGKRDDANKHRTETIALDAIIEKLTALKDSKSITNDF